MDVFNIFNKKDCNKSKNVAKDRLKLVLIHDRINCSPDLLDKIKNDIIDVISKYVEFDVNDLDINISNSSDEGREVPVLYANIPITNMKQDA